MGLVDADLHPDDRKLKSFATAAFIAGAAAAFTFYALGAGLAAAAVAAAGLSVFLSSIVCPAVTRAVYVGLVAAVWPIGWVVSFLLLAAVYFLVLTPVGLFFRLVGRDELGLRTDRSAPTYWQETRRDSDQRRYFKQF